MGKANETRIRIRCSLASIHNSYHKPFKTTYNIIADLAKIPLAFSGY